MGTNVVFLSIVLLETKIKFDLKTKCDTVWQRKYSSLGILYKASITCWSWSKFNYALEKPLCTPFCTRTSLCVGKRPFNKRKIKQSHMCLQGAISNCSHRIKEYRVHRRTLPLKILTSKCKCPIKLENFVSV